MASKTAASCVLCSGPIKMDSCTHLIVLHVAQPLTGEARQCLHAVKLMSTCPCLHLKKVAQHSTAQRSRC